MQPFLRLVRIVKKLDSILRSQGKQNGKNECDFTQNTVVVEVCDEKVGHLSLTDLPGAWEPQETLDFQLTIRTSRHTIDH